MKKNIISCLIKFKYNLFKFYTLYNILQKTKKNKTKYNTKKIFFVIKNINNKIRNKKNKAKHYININIK